jgi:hypothetical protein
MRDIARHAGGRLVSPGLPVRAIVRGAAVVAVLAATLWASIMLSDDFTRRIGSRSNGVISTRGEKIFVWCAPREFYTPAPDCPYVSHRAAGHP